MRALIIGDGVSLYAASKVSLKTFIKVAQKEMRRYQSVLLEPQEIPTLIQQKVSLTPQNPLSEAFAQRRRLVYHQ